MTALSQKRAAHAYARAFAHPDPDGWGAAAGRFFDEGTAFHLCHPFNDLDGPVAYFDGFLAPLAQAFDGLCRRDDILMGGRFEGQDWVSAHGNYAGHFARDWLGITATGRLEYLRFGEFHRMAGDRAVETWIFLDIPQLMIATGQWPIKDSPGRDRGYTGFVPGPATQDGILLAEAEGDRTGRTLRIVEDMLSGLATEDEAWRPFWHPNMVWYGPAAFGSFIGIEHFAGFQVPFENAFSTWSGGSNGNGITRHFTRFADGDYVCTGGWPSLLAVQKDTFLGQLSKGDALYMRVCDWWRCEGDLLAENWVFVDIPDVLLQMGVDLFEGLHDVAPGPREAA